MIERREMSGGKTLACLVGIPAAAATFMHLAMYIWNPVQYKIDHGLYNTPSNYVGKIADENVIFQQIGSWDVFGSYGSSAKNNLLLVIGKKGNFTTYKAKINLKLEGVVVQAQGDNVNVVERYSNSNEAPNPVMEAYQNTFY